MKWGRILAKGKNQSWGENLKSWGKYILNNTSSLLWQDISKQFDEKEKAVYRLFKLFACLCYTQKCVEKTDGNTKKKHLNLQPIKVKETKWVFFLEKLIKILLKSLKKYPSIQLKKCKSFEHFWFERNFWPLQMPRGCQRTSASSSASNVPESTARWEFTSRRSSRWRWTTSAPLNF